MIPILSWFSLVLSSSSTFPPLQKQLNDRTQIIEHSIKDFESSYVQKKYIKHVEPFDSQISCERSFFILMTLSCWKYIDRRVFDPWNGQNIIHMGNVLTVYNKIVLFQICVMIDTRFFIDIGASIISSWDWWHCNFPVQIATLSYYWKPPCIYTFQLLALRFLLVGLWQLFF